MKQILILFFIMTKLYSQNFIKNPSFESRVGAPDSVPNNLAQFRFLDNWDEDMNDNHHNEDGNRVYLHSSDFYSSSHHIPEYIIDRLYGGQPIFAQDGNNYVGMARGELIEQEFEESELEAGKQYHIEFYIQPSKSTYIENINWNNYTILSVMLTKSKLKYTSSANNYTSSCTAGFNDHISENNSTLHLSDMQISTTQYPFGIWSKVSVDFTAPLNADEYDWFVVETNDPNPNTCDTYLLLDNFSFTKVCTDRCSAYRDTPDGSISCNNIHSCSNPLTFNGLKGAERVVLHIYENWFGSGQDEVYRESFTHPNNTISWNGIYNWGGNTGEAINANFRYSLEVFSLCGQNGEHHDNFTKTGNCPFGIHPFISPGIGAFGLIGLDNVNSLKIVINDMSGNEVRTIEINDPFDKVLWDGKNNSGAYVAQANYIANCTYFTNCGQSNSVLSFMLFSTGASYFNFNSTYFNYGSNNLINNIDCSDFINLAPVNYPPLPCCSSEPDINLTTGYILGTESFEAYGNIYIGPVVTVLPASNLEFIANGTITIDPGVSFDGSISPVILEYQNCSPQRIGYWPTSVIENNQAIEESKIVETQQETSNKNLLLFPNPTKLTLTLVFPNSKKLAVVVTDMLGKIMLKNSIYNSNPELDVSSLPNGIYFLEAFTETESFIQKFVKE